MTDFSATKPTEVGFRWWKAGEGAWAGPCHIAPSTYGHESLQCLILGADDSVPLDTMPGLFGPSIPGAGEVCEWRIDCYNHSVRRQCAGDDLRRAEYLYGEFCPFCGRPIREVGESEAGDDNS